jgi:hypothetical protein
VIEHGYGHEDDHARPSETGMPGPPHAASDGPGIWTGGLGTWLGPVERSRADYEVTDGLVADLLEA